MSKKIIVAVSVALIFAAFVVVLRSSRGLNSLDQVALAASPKAPELIGASTDWLNTSSNPLHLYGPAGILKDDPLAPGKHPVVLIDFWEYTCVNCLNTLPYVKQWAARYTGDGLIVIGVHTPEFQFAHDRVNVAGAVKRLGITYPVLVDSGYDNWNAYNNQFWPNEYMIDSSGRIVSNHPGEGDYAQTEQEIRRRLLAANPGETLPAAYGDGPASGEEASGPVTGELYCGSARGQLQNPEGFGSGVGTTYAAIPPNQWQDGQLVVSGQWRFGDEYVEHARPNAEDYVGVRYSGRTSVAVIKPQTTQPFDVTVTQDGQPVSKANAGTDLHYGADGHSFLVIDAPREYQITRNPDDSSHTLALYPGGGAFRLYELDFTPGG
jgi:thiol-disulfide isomerase/thioredoxin